MIATLLVADEGAAQILRDAGHRVCAVADGQAALERIAPERPDLVVMDAQLRGLEACRAIKRRGEFLPVLLIVPGASPRTAPRSAEPSGAALPGASPRTAPRSAEGAAPSRLEGLRAGADDVLSRPLDADELCARVEVWLRTRRLVGGARPLGPEAAGQDRLTGLPDQRAFTQLLDEEFGRAERARAPLSVMAADVDRMDEINGRFGRGVGDRLLVACARALVRACAEGSLVARAGGDELVVLLPGLHFIGCVTLAERMQRELAQTIIVEAGARLACGASIGVASFPSQGIETANDLLRMAHAALARAKAEGKGRVCLYQVQGYLFHPQLAP